MVDADTRTIQTLLPQGKAGGMFIISPDGKRVALVYPNGIDLLNLNTHEKYNMNKYDPVMVPSEVGGYLNPEWSKDSSYLMVVVPPQDIYYGTTLPSKIWKLPVNHQAPHLISTIGPEFGIVVLSPDFTKIASRRLEGNEQVSGLHIGNVDGTDEEIYQTGKLFFVNWLPDSSAFLYQNNENGKSYLGQIGVPPVEVPFRADDLRWLNDQTFLYNKGPDESREIRLGFLDGTSTLLVGPTSIDNFDFAK